MTPDQYDLVIVGTGTAGMAAAEFAATLELRVAAVEHGRVGGTRVWSGGVPSNALRAAGRAVSVGVLCVLPFATPAASEAQRPTQVVARCASTPAT